MNQIIIRKVKRQQEELKNNNRNRTTQQEELKSNKRFQTTQQEELTNNKKNSTMTSGTE